MPDKDRTPENDERDERDEDEAAEKANSRDEAAEKAKARDEADEADEADAVKARAAGDEEAEHKDDAAARVAAALGVDESEEGEDAAKAGAEQEEEKKAKPNRAARRREEARKRRGSGEEELPRDKNARAKELLKRRQSQASERQGRVGSQLEASEMVEDVVARAGSSARKWIVKNFAMVQAGVVIALLVTGGVLFYLSRAEEKGGAVSDALAAAVAADRGRVLAEDKRSDDEKDLDPAKIYKTPEERAEAALGAYKQVAEEYPGTGAAILAQLGQAGVLLEKKEWDAALAAYGAVSASPLAGADPDVKGRAVEGMGFAKEGKGDFDGALAHFKELESIDVRGFKELGMYHQARMHLAKGDKEKAKELLKAAREKLAAPGSTEKTSQFLEAVVDEALRQLDPSAVPARAQLGGPKGSSITPEELQRLLEQAKQKAGGQ